MKNDKIQNAFNSRELTISALVSGNYRTIGVTWLFTLIETALTALIPLFVGLAIDGLVKKEASAVYVLALLLAGLILISVIRRIYDTRVYGAIRVGLGLELINRSGDLSVSSQNARLDMGRELVDFLEHQVPEIMNSVVQFVVALIVLWSFHSYLAVSAITSVLLMIVVYGVSHRRFFQLNSDYNQQVEQQVHVLGLLKRWRLFHHLKRIRQIEVRLSDTEAYTYGVIFFVLAGFVIFNLWFAASNMSITPGIIFVIVSYSWEFVEAALVLPTTLQGWSRLSEIMKRINGNG